MQVPSLLRPAALMLLAGVFTVHAADLPSLITSAINAEPGARQCFWGIRVQDATTGEVLYSLNEDKFFVPASNTKLFTSSLALRRLGPDYRFRTRVEVDAKPDTRGRVRELRLIGGGDPNLSARLIPYSNEETQGSDPLAALRTLADQVAASGVRVIDGDVVGDDTAYEWEPFPDGWGLDDATWEYGAPVSALTLNDNAFKLTVLPGAGPGMPASLTLTPSIEYLTVHNRTQTVADGPTRLSFDRVAGSRELTVSGNVRLGSTPQPVLLGVDDPAFFAAQVFRRLLQERGIQVTGGVRAEHRLRGRLPEDQPAWAGVEVAAHESAPLAQILQILNKVSQNLHTELVLREIARTKTGIGSRETGLAMITDYLKEIGVPEGQWTFADASGLSRLGLVTPAAVATLLTSMYNTPLREAWIDTLPVGGVDGTLERRFAKDPLASRIHAKTGSLSHVAGLSGYARREDGRTLAFAMLVNNYNAPGNVIRGVMDKVALALLQ